MLWGCHRAFSIDLGLHFEVLDLEFVWFFMYNPQIHVLANYIEYLTSNESDDVEGCLTIFGRLFAQCLAFYTSSHTSRMTARI